MLLGPHVVHTSRILSISRLGRTQFGLMKGLDFLYAGGTPISGTLPLELTKIELDSLHIGRTCVIPSCC